MSLPRRSRYKLVLLSLLYAASPRKDVASDWKSRFGGVASDGCFAFGPVAFEAARCYHLPGVQVIARLQG